MLGATMEGFRVGGRRVSIFVFDVALLTGLPTTGQIIDLDGDEVTTDVGEMVCDRMAEWEKEEMDTRLPGRSGKKSRFFRNYVSDMVALCEENNEDDRVGLWVKIYAFIIMSRVLFLLMPYGAAWGTLRYVEDVQKIGEYNWAQSEWRVVVDTIEEIQKKLCAGPLTEVQLNGFCLLFQVWFYEHMTRFVDQDKKRYPHFASWAGLIMGEGMLRVNWLKILRRKR